MSIEMDNEIWKDIKVRSDYQVSTNGQVRNKITGKILKPCINNRSGYYHIGLSIDGQHRTFYIHRLVAEAFIGERPDGYQINHIDGNKLNNRFDNLEYCSRSDNIKHSYRTGLNSNVIPIRIVETGEEFESIEACARAIDGDSELIRQCIIPKYPRNTHKGCHFEPVNEYTTGRKALKIRIVETGEVFDSILKCEEAVGGAHTNITLAAKNGITYKGLHYEFVEETPMKEKTKPFLYDYQMEAVNKVRNGSILCGSVGSGKSRTGLFYYFKENGGWIDENGYIPMKNPQDLYIITTAKKRDSMEFEGELAHFRMSIHPDINNIYNNKIVIDSWNNIKKYSDVRGAFFLLDEQRIVGNGTWVKSFLKIAKNNNWILLSATPGDSYVDYVPVFIANGFFKNRTEFNREHVIYSRFTKYPKIDKFIGTTRLDRLRDRVLVQMNYKHKINTHHEDIYCTYNIADYKDAVRHRWDKFKNEPIQQASGLCYVLRRIVNEDESRQTKLLELLEDIPRAIIFYNFNYEREILLNLAYGDDVEIAEWSGHAHQSVPDSKKWIYLCQYTSACEGWECTKTNVIIFYSQNYSYKTMVQAAGRIDRLNSPFRDLFYYHLKSRSGIDLAISKALKDKKKFNERRFANWD